MAAVSVFVDDAVRGRLPLVCATTGEPADLVIRTQHPVGAGMHPAAWLLLLLGPLGLAGLVLLALVTPGREYLTVRIPRTAAAYESQRSRERLRLGLLLAAPALALSAILFRTTFPALWLALAAVVLVAGLIVHVELSAAAIRIHLDASRRWVTLTGVHPAFAEAVDDRERLATAGGR